MKVCPLCKTPITLTLRYMKYVKKVYVDILKVKKKIFGTEFTLTKRKEQLREKIRKLKKESQVNIKIIGIKAMPKMMNEYLKKIGQKQQRITTSNGELDTIEFFSQALIEINSRLDELCEAGIEGEPKQLHRGATTLRVIKYLDALFVRMLEPAIQINEQLFEDIAFELRRFHKMVDFSLVMRNPLYVTRKNDATVCHAVKRLEGEVFGFRRFIPSVENEVNKTFEDLKKALNTLASLTNDEKRMINEAMSKDFAGGRHSTGHWYTCSNGHYYVITECGGAMERGKCPECQEVIGGENHRIVDTARLASDMDGAQRPAWV